MGVQVSFSYSSFVAQFPTFGYLTSDQVQNYWTMATGFVHNDGGGLVCSQSIQSALLNLATAHLCQLFAPTAQGQAASPLVGRISNASEGSVSIATEMQMPAGTAQWWNQSPYGAAAWEMMKPYRTMRYIPGPQRWFNPWPVQ